MMFKITAALLLAIVCSASAKGIQGAVSKDICEQCRVVTGAVKTYILQELERTESSDLSAGICDLDDDELRNQCFDLFQNHGDDIRDFLENLDEDAVCDEMICKELDQMGLSDLLLDNDNLYFRSAMSATSTDEVGNFICPICKQFMRFIHSFLTGKKHQGFVLHLIKGVCHYVPIFRMQCELLVNMYGRLILNLAARYLNPNLCVVFRLCPRHQSSLKVCPLVKINASGAHNAEQLLFLNVDLTLDKDCRLCELLVGLIVDTLEDPHAVARIQKLLRYLCRMHQVQMSACQKDLIDSVPTFLKFLKRSTWIRNVCKKAAFCRGERQNGNGKQLFQSIHP